MSSVLLSGSFNTTSVKVRLALRTEGKTLLNSMKVRLVDQEAGKELGNLVTGYSRDYQVESVLVFRDK